MSNIPLLQAVNPDQHPLETYQENIFETPLKMVISFKRATLIDNYCHGHYFWGVGVGRGGDNPITLTERWRKPLVLIDRKIIKNNYMKTFNILDQNLLSVRQKTH